MHTSPCTRLHAHASMHTPPCTHLHVYSTSQCTYTVLQLLGMFTKIYLKSLSARLYRWGCFTELPLSWGLVSVFMWCVFAIGWRQAGPCQSDCIWSIWTTTKGERKVKCIIALCVCHTCTYYVWSSLVTGAPLICFQSLTPVDVSYAYVCIIIIIIIIVKVAPSAQGWNQWGIPTRVYIKAAVNINDSVID